MCFTQGNKGKSECGKGEIEAVKVRKMSIENEQGFWGVGKDDEDKRDAGRNPTVHGRRKKKRERNAGRERRTKGVCVGVCVGVPVQGTIN